jgi:hypothetical protein
MRVSPEISALTTNIMMSLVYKSNEDLSDVIGDGAVVKFGPAAGVENIVVHTIGSTYLKNNDSVKNWWV